MCAPAAMISAALRNVILRRDLEGAERHIADDEGPLGAARDALHVINDVAQRDRQGGLVALQNVAKRIADEQRFDPRGFQQRREARVVAGELSDLLALLRHLVKIREGDSHARAAPIWGAIIVPERIVCCAATPEKRR